MAPDYNIYDWLMSFGQSNCTVDHNIPHDPLSPELQRVWLHLKEIVQAYSRPHLKLSSNLTFEALTVHFHCKRSPVSTVSKDKTGVGSIKAEIYSCYCTARPTVAGLRRDRAMALHD